ncbi:C40 family peptidase [Nitratireductor sp. L1-7-SE]|uniref:C40 family peptidase n=1 Tax=Nitratireductor rhodophyticola TaxID=2854036 RepID=A0ABS7R8M0_9HYPH|nr:NlpC/P60 family protein [Nitratireductor rhodophyticola]MBY8917267.1 C40 family peptidase [Nitratireductor rhodophyticola]MBY8920304.1 C40 family peptidase [Nitratireductor rhodophyticola]
MTTLDRRLHAHRADLADARLEGRVKAERFTAGTPARIGAPVVDVHSAPRLDAGIDTQFLHGDRVRVFERREGWAWVQAEHDGYVGYVNATSLANDDVAPTHRVRAQRSFVYPEPELKAPAIAAHSIGAAVCVTETVENRGTRYALLASGGAMIAGHLQPLDTHDEDYVTVAETFLHTPYLWGGASGFGIDCSGLVQLSMRMAGRTVLRDTDMQAASIGTVIEPDQTGLSRGDLVFWKGHVAIMLDHEMMLHANGNTMTVARELLKDAIERIERLYGRPTHYRRP